MHQEAAVLQPLALLGLWGAVASIVAAVVPEELFVSEAAAHCWPVLEAAPHRWSAAPANRVWLVNLMEHSRSVALLRVR